MTQSNDDIRKLLKKIVQLLEPISACFEDEYRELQLQRTEAKLDQLKKMLTPTRRRIYALLFDPRRLSQQAIASEAGTSQPTVSRFVSALLERGLIEQAKDRNGNVVYEDTLGLSTMMERSDEHDG